MTRQRAVTLRQVAAHAAVSRQTVSNAINAPHRLGPATLARVTKAINELQYKPNRSARSLSTGNAGGQYRTSESVERAIRTIRDAVPGANLRGLAADNGTADGGAIAGSYKVGMNSLQRNASRPTRSESQSRQW